MYHPRWSLLHINTFYEKKFINDYKQTMLSQCLVLLGAANLQKSIGRSSNAVNSLQASKEGAFHAHMLVQNFCIIFQTYILRQAFCLSFVYNLFLIFQQISGSCSYKIVLIQKEFRRTRKVRIERNQMQVSNALSYHQI